MSSLEKFLLRSFAHFLNWIVYLPGIESYEFFIYFGKYVLPYNQLPFHFDDGFLSYASAF